MYDWVINVSTRDGFTFNGGPRYLHYFRIKLENGHYNEDQARERYNAIRAAFDRPAYKVMLQRWTRPKGTTLEDQ